MLEDTYGRTGLKALALPLAAIAWRAAVSASLMLTAGVKVPPIFASSLGLESGRVGIGDAADRSRCSNGSRSSSAKTTWSRDVGNRLGANVEGVSRRSNTRQRSREIAGERRHRLDVANRRLQQFVQIRDLLAGEVGRHRQLTDNLYSLPKPLAAGTTSKAIRLPCFGSQKADSPCPETCAGIDESLRYFGGLHDVPAIRRDHVDQYLAEDFAEPFRNLPAATSFRMPSAAALTAL